MHRRPRISPQGRGIVSRVRLNRIWPVMFALVVMVAMGTAILPGFAAKYAKAMGATPGQPTFFNGSPGDQQVNLNWGAATDATSYIIEQTDLETGQVQRLSPPVTETSFSPGGLLTGQWYRFRVIPVNDEGEGIPSNPIEIRTTGFRGTYDHYYALGDSYSAGDGAPPYSGIQACTQSTKSYPYLLGNGVPTPVLLACTGAVTDNIDRTI